MKTYFALFLISATASLGFTPLLRRLCERYRLVDEPQDNRRVHLKAVPRLGGVAIFVALLITLSVLLLLNNLLTQTLRPERRGIIVFLVCGVLVLALGVYDDLSGANAKVKFAGLTGVATLFYLLGSDRNSFDSVCGRRHPSSYSWFSIDIDLDRGHSQRL